MAEKLEHGSSPDVKILVGIKGGASISGESANLIRKQLESIFKSLKTFDIKVRIDPKTKQTLDSFAASFNAAVNNGGKVGKNGSSGSTRSGKSGTQIVDPVKVQSAQVGLSALYTKNQALIDSTDTLKQRYQQINALIADPTKQAHTKRELDSIKSKIGLFKAEISAQNTKNANTQRAIADSEKLNAQNRQAVALISNMTQFEGRLSGNAALNTTYQSLKSRAGDFKSLDDAKRWTTEWAAFNKECRTAGITVQSTAQRIGASMKKFTQWFGISQLVMLAVRSIRKMLSTIVELDTAMVELRKVTEGTETTYANFFTNASKRAQELAASLTDVINASADFARLGYNIADASALADVAVVYQHVADGVDDISTATSHIISTLKAFKISADDAMSVADKFNEVANRFPITAASIGEIMTRSASAMYAAGNTLDQTVALGTVGYAVVQDASIVGTALKTLSMRLRNTRTEMEAAGEDTDSMASSTSVLREQLLGLTNQSVDIMLDENTYKSTYQILLEMSQVWGEMSDIDQSAALKLMGGVRQAQTLSAIITSMSDAEDVLAASLDSAGSALKENKKVVDSLQGHLNQISASFQELSSNIFDSDSAKTFLGIVNEILKVLSEFAKYAGGVGFVGVAASFVKIIKDLKTANTLIPQFQNAINVGRLGKTTWDTGGAAKLIAALGNVNAAQEAATLSAVGLNGAQMAQYSTAKTGIPIEDTRNIVLDAYNSSLVVGTSAQQANNITDMEDVVLTEAQIAVINKHIDATNTDTASVKANAAARKAAMASNWIGWIMLAISAIISVINAVKQAKAEAEAARQELSDLIESLNDELADNLKLIEEINSKGVLTWIDAQEIKRLETANDQLRATIRIKSALLDKENEVATAQRRNAQRLAIYSNAKEHAMGAYSSDAAAYRNEPEAMRDVQAASDTLESAIAFRTDQLLSAWAESQSEEDYAALQELINSYYAFASELEAVGDTEGAQMYYDQINNIGIALGLADTPEVEAKKTALNELSVAAQTSESAFRDATAALLELFGISIGDMSGLTSLDFLQMVIDKAADGEKAWVELRDFLVERGLLRQWSAHGYGSGYRIPGNLQTEFAASSDNRAVETWKDVADLSGTEGLGSEYADEVATAYGDITQRVMDASQAMHDFATIAPESGASVDEIAEAEERLATFLGISTEELHNQAKDGLGESDAAFSLYNSRIAEANGSLEFLLMQFKSMSGADYDAGMQPSELAKLDQTSRKIWELITALIALNTIEQKGDSVTVIPTDFDIPTTGGGGKRSIYGKKYQQDIEYLEHIISLQERLINLYEEGSDKWIERQTKIIQQYQASAAVIEAEYERLLKRGYSATHEDMLELSDALLDMQENAFEAAEELWDALRENEINSLEHLADQTDAVISLKEAYHDLSTSVRDELRSIEKELKVARDAYPNLTDAERESLFTDEEYSELSSKLNSIIAEADIMYEDYLSQIQSVGEDANYELEHITEEFERQYDLKMKEYEVAKAELGVIRAQKALENTQNERNVSMLIDGRWQWVADPDAVKKAMEDLADAESGLIDAEGEMAFEAEIGNLEDYKSEIELQIGALESLTFSMDELAGEIHNLSDTLQALLLSKLTSSSQALYDAFISTTSGGTGTGLLSGSLAQAANWFGSSETARLYSAVLASGGIGNLNTSLFSSSLRSGLSNNLSAPQVVNTGPYADNRTYINGVQVSTTDGALLVDIFRRNAIVV